MPESTIFFYGLMYLFQIINVDPFSNKGMTIESLEFSATIKFF
jgi:hypothetical protein